MGPSEGLGVYDLSLVSHLGPLRWAVSNLLQMSFHHQVCLVKTHRKLLLVVASLLWNSLPSYSLPYPKPGHLPKVVQDILYEQVFSKQVQVAVLFGSFCCIVYIFYIILLIFCMFDWLCSILVYLSFTVAHFNLKQYNSSPQMVETGMTSPQYTHYLHIFISMQVWATDR